MKMSTLPVHSSIVAIVPLIALLFLAATGCGRLDDVRMEPHLYPIEGLNSRYDLYLTALPDLECLERFQ